MRSEKETAVAEHGVIARVDLVERCQFDLGSGTSNRRKAFQADRIVGTVSVVTMWECAERAGHRAASFPGEAQAYSAAAPMSTR
jgi:hypothetical protein